MYLYQRGTKEERAAHKGGVLPEDPNLNSREKKTRVSQKVGVKGPAVIYANMEGNPMGQTTEMISGVNSHSWGAGNYRRSCRQMCKGWSDQLLFTIIRFRPGLIVVNRETEHNAESLRGIVPKYAGRKRVELSKNFGNNIYKCLIIYESGKIPAYVRKVKRKSEFGGHSRWKAYQDAQSNRRGRISQKNIIEQGRGPGLPIEEEQTDDLALNLLSLKGNSETQ